MAWIYAAAGFATLACIGCACWCFLAVAACVRLKREIAEQAQEVRTSNERLLAGLEKSAELRQQLALAAYFQAKES